MSCSITIEMEIRADIEMMAKEGIIGAQVLEEGSVIFANKTQDNTGLLAQMRKNIADINEKYSNAGKHGRIAKLNTGHIYGLSIDIYLPLAVVEEQVENSNMVNEIEASKRLQMEDAKRSGETFIPESPFDEMLNSTDTPTNPDAYDYGLVLDKKKEYRDYLSHRINVLKEVPNQTKEIKNQVAQLTTAVKKLSNDIRELEKGENTVHNFFNFFNKDLSNIEKILKKAPTLENITAVQNYFDSLSPVLEVDALRADATKNNRFSINNTPGNIQDAEVAKLFADFKAKHDKLKDDFKIVSNEYVKEVLKISAGTGGSALAEEELTKFKKFVEYSDGLLEFLFLPIDGQGDDSSTLQALVRKFYDDAIAKKEKASVQGELMALKPLIEKKLSNSGVNILGFTFSKKDYGIFKRLTKEGNYRLVSKFSDSWDTLKDEVGKLLWEASNSKVDTAGLSSLQIEQNLKMHYTEVRGKRRMAFQKLMDEGVEFIDSTMLPEFALNAELNGETLPNIEELMGFAPGTIASQFNSTLPQRQAYKDKLLKTLGGNTSNMKIAQKEYDKLQKKQLEQIFEFEATLNEKVQTALEQEGVSNFNNLSAERQAKIKTFYYTNSPLEFVKLQKDNNNTGKVPTSSIKTGSVYLDETGTQKETRETATLKYVSYLPTSKKSYNSKFEKEIESDETLLRAWELFDESYEFLNKNRKYENTYSGKYSPEYLDSITNQYDTAQDNALRLRHGSNHFESTGAKFGYNLFENILSTLGTNTKKDNAKMQINGAIKSLDEVVEDETNFILQAFEATGYKGRVLIKSFSTSSPNGGQSPLNRIIEMLEQRGMKISDANLSLKENIKMAVRERIFKNQDNDMVKSIVSQLSAVQVFKAKKEVEVPMKYLAGIASKINKEDSSLANQRRVNIIKYFIESNLYGKTTKDGVKAGFLHFKVLNSEERYFTHLAEITKREKQKLVDSGKFSPDVQLAMEQSIRDLDEAIKSKGTEISVGAIIEGIFIKLAITAGLGWNLKSQLLNKALGNLATRQNDGTFWESGNSVAALSYARTWKRALKSMSTKHKNNLLLTDSILDTMAIFQNSANDIEEMEKETTIKGLSKFENLKPLAIISEVEKEIQRPQILAMMGDMKIYGKNNTVVPAFNVKDTSNPHPAFEIVNGRLQLKEEFDTQANRDTWILKKSPEYSDNFGNSGKIPTAIAKMNGDYRKTSRVMMKKSLPGAILMIYKTWMASHIIRRYGKEGVYTQLADKGHLANSLMVLGGIAAGASTLGGLTVVAPFLGLGIVAGSYALKNGRRAMNASIAKDALTINRLIRDITIANTKTAFLSGTKGTLNIVKGGLGVGLGGTLKVAQQLTDLSGKRIIKDSLINKSLFMEQGESETDAEYKRNLANMQFLLTELATMAQIVAAKALVNLFLTPDDDEEDEYKDATFLERVSNHRATMIYYLSENLLGQFGQDMAFSVNPYSATNLLTEGIGKTVADLLTAVGKTVQGNPEIGSGKNKGRNRIWVQVEKMSTPVGVRDILQGKIPTVGFGNPSETDYNKADFFNKKFMSNAERFEKAKRKVRETFREEKFEELKLIYTENTDEEIKAEVERLNNIEHPSIKNIFNEKGELIDPGHAEYLAKYDEELANEIIQKRDKK